MSHQPQTLSKKPCVLIKRPLYNEKGIPEAAEEHEAKPVCRFVLILLAAAGPEAQAGLGLRKRGRDARLAAPRRCSLCAPDGQKMKAQFKPFRQPDPLISVPS